MDSATIWRTRTTRPHAVISTSAMPPYQHQILGPVGLQDTTVARRHLRKGDHPLSTDENKRPPLVCLKGDVLEVVRHAYTIELL